MSFRRLSFRRLSFRRGQDRPRGNFFKSLRLMSVRFGTSHAAGRNQHGSEDSAGYHPAEVSDDQRLQATKADRWLAMLTSSLLILLTINTTLLLIWWCSFRFVDPPIPIPRPIGGGADFVADPWAEWDEVSLNEIPEMLEPQLSDTVIRPVVMTEEYEGLNAGGPFDLRLKGEPLPTDSGKQRWVIRYRVFDQHQYLKMLQSMGTELACVQDTTAGRRLVYLNLVGGAKTSGLPENEQRVYFHQTRNPFLSWDRMLMEQFGVELEPSQTVLHFHSAATLNAMQQLVEAQLKKDGQTEEQIDQALFQIDSQQQPLWRLIQLRYIQKNETVPESQVDISAIFSN